MLNKLTLVVAVGCFFFAGDNFAQEKKTPAKNYVVVTAVQGEVSRLRADGKSWIRVQRGAPVPLDSLISVGRESAIVLEFPGDRGGSFAIAEPSMFRANKSLFRKRRNVFERFTFDFSQAASPSQDEIKTILRKRRQIIEPFAMNWRRFVAVFQDLSPPEKLTAVTEKEAEPSQIPAAVGHEEIPSPVIFPENNEVLIAEKFPFEVDLKLMKLEARESYRLSVRNDANNLIFREDFKVDHYGFSIPQPGSYTMQLQIIAADGKNIVSEHVQNIAAMPRPDGEPPEEEKKRDGILSYRDIQATPQPMFRWLGADLSKPIYFDWQQSADNRPGVVYRLVVSNAGNKTVADVRTKKTSAQVNLKALGNYVWSLEALNSFGDILWKSRPRFLALSGQALSLQDYGSGVIYFENGFEGIK